jgi:predicted ribosomally synthesized peptide with SipW-like signal peptide
MGGEQRIRVSRRGVLGTLGAMGVAAAGAGVGTTALFSDEEEFGNNSVAAGELDLKVAWRRVISAELAAATGAAEAVTSDDFPNPTNTVDAPIVDLSDLKPGDGGHIEFFFQIDDNPGYLSLLGATQADEENGQPEPEQGSLSESIPAGREGELDEFLETTVSYGSVTDDTVNRGTRAYTASLASLVELGSVGTGIPLDGGGDESVSDILMGGATPDAFDGGTLHGLRVDFELPTTVGNGIQTDSFRFALGFYAEQARHNQP